MKFFYTFLLCSCFTWAKAQFTGGLDYGWGYNDKKSCMMIGLDAGFLIKQHFYAGYNQRVVFNDYDPGTFGLKMGYVVPVSPSLRCILYTGPYFVLHSTDTWGENYWTLGGGAQFWFKNFQFSAAYVERPQVTIGFLGTIMSGEEYMERRLSRQGGCNY